MSHHAKTLETLLDDLRQLVGDAEKLLAAAATEHSREAIDSLRTRLESTRDRVTALCADAKKKVAAGARYTDEAIRENPYRSLAVAAGAGLLIGLLLGRRNR